MAANLAKELASLLQANVTDHVMLEQLNRLGATLEHACRLEAALLRKADSDSPSVTFSKRFLLESARVSILRSDELTMEEISKEFVIQGKDENEQTGLRLDWSTDRVLNPSMGICNWNVWLSIPIKNSTEKRILFEASPYHTDMDREYLCNLLEAWDSELSLRDKKWLLAFALSHPSDLCFDVCSNIIE